MDGWAGILIRPAEGAAMESGFTFSLIPLLNLSNQRSDLLSWPSVIFINANGSGRLSLRPYTRSGRNGFSDINIRAGSILDAENSRSSARLAFISEVDPFTLIGPCAERRVVQCRKDIRAIVILGSITRIDTAGDRKNLSRQANDRRRGRNSEGERQSEQRTDLEH